MPANLSELFQTLFFVALRRRVGERLSSIKDELWALMEKELQQKLGRKLTDEEVAALGAELLNMLGDACEDIVEELRNRLDRKHPDLAKIREAASRPS